MNYGNIIVAITRLKTPVNQDPRHHAQPHDHSSRDAIHRNVTNLRKDEPVVTLDTGSSHFLSQIVIYLTKRS